MSGAIHDLGHSKATVKLYQRIFVLVEKAKKKIGIPAGTYKFVNETFRYVVKITWNGLDLQIISNGGGQFPKKIEGWTAAAKGKVPKALVKLIWQTVGVHRSKR